MKNKNEETYGMRVDSPIGELLLSATTESLVGLYMNAHRYGPEDTSGWEFGEVPSVLSDTALQLREYFEGQRQVFDLPLSSKGTAFQMRCWDELTRIPYGETWSYGSMAKRVGDANASRAVGAANGRNPISIIVPCHRVIGATGKLVGFGGGLARKAALLSFERAIQFGESAQEFWVTTLNS